MDATAGSVVYPARGTVPAGTLVEQREVAALMAGDFMRPHEGWPMNENDPDPFRHALGAFDPDECEICWLATK